MKMSQGSRELVISLIVAGSFFPHYLYVKRTKDARQVVLRLVEGVTYMHTYR